MSGERGGKPPSVRFSTGVVGVVGLATYSGVLGMTLKAANLKIDDVPSSARGAAARTDYRRGRTR